MKPAKRRRGRPPGSTGEATRESILRAARGCFARKGYSVATNRDIAKDAGVTAAAIYQYFDSKHALYAAVAHETITVVTEHMRAAADNEASAVAGLASTVRTLLAVHEQDPLHAAFLSVLPADLRRHPELLKHIELGNTDLAESMRGIIVRGVAAGEIDADDGMASAQMFVACMMGLSQYALLIADGRSPGLAFARLLEGTLFAPATPRRQPAPRATQAKTTKRPR